MRVQDTYISRALILFLMSGFMVHAARVGLMRRMAPREQYNVL